MNEGMIGGQVTSGHRGPVKFASKAEARRKRCVHVMHILRIATGQT